jgi:hypothetical protein
MDTYAHDGAAWRKLKQIYAHDGTDWRKLKEVWERGRCVYQDREFVELAGGPSFVESIVLDSTGNILAAASTGVFRYNVTSGLWSAIGSFGRARAVADIGGTIYASGGSQVARWTGSAWVAAHSNFLNDNVYALERCAAGLLILGGTSIPKIISGGAWVNYGTQSVQAAQLVAGTCYGISYGGDVLNVDANTILYPGGPGAGVTDPSLTFHGISASEMYFSGTYGTYKWDGSTRTRILGSDSRLPRAVYMGWPIGVPTFARVITAYGPPPSKRPVGDQTLGGYWNSFGSSTGLNIGDTLYMIIYRTSPTRWPVHEFRLK